MFGLFVVDDVVGNVELPEALTEVVAMVFWSF